MTGGLDRVLGRLYLAMESIQQSAVPEQANMFEHALIMSSCDMHME